MLPLVIVAEAGGTSPLYILVFMLSLVIIAEVGGTSPLYFLVGFFYLGWTCLFPKECDRSKSSSSGAKSLVPVLELNSESPERSCEMKSLQPKGRTEDTVGERILSLQREGGGQLLLCPPDLLPAKYNHSSDPSQTRRNVWQRLAHFAILIPKEQKCSLF